MNNIELLEMVVRSSSLSEIRRAAKYINKGYNIFASNEQNWKMIVECMPLSVSNLIADYHDGLLANEFINDLLFKFYPCERTIKFAIIEKLREKRDTVLFEMPILASRVDVCRINGHSYAYEIKTAFDTYKRLPKQLEDYSKIFEFTYLVIPIERYKAIIDTVYVNCGIITYENINGNILMTNRKKPIKSILLDPKEQLNCLSMKDLKTIVKQNNIITNALTKTEFVEDILQSLGSRINKCFKDYIKASYKNKWEYIKENFTEILPIDMQIFFKSPMNPKIFYTK